MRLSREAGGEKMTLGVISENSGAVALYEKLGFEREGLSTRAFKTTDGRYLDDVMMAKFI